MTDDCPAPDPFRPAWALLAAGLFTGLVFLAVAAYHWWQAALLRPLD